MSRRNRWRVEFLPSARRELLALPDRDRDHVRDAIRLLADGPMSATSIPMRGKGIGLYRLRVGRIASFIEYKLGKSESL